MAVFYVLTTRWPLTRSYTTCLDSTHVVLISRCANSRPSQTWHDKKQLPKAE